MKKTIFAFFILLILGLVASRFLIQTDKFLFTHDHTHLARLYLLAKTLHFGQIPAVWADLTNHGFGYPLFHFYAPLFYYFALLLHWLTFMSLTLALNLSVIFFLVLGSWGVFKLLKPFGFSSAILGAVAYLTLPYLALDIYVRGAYAELSALALLPWLLQVWLPLKKLPPKKHFFALTLVTTLFLLSHNLIPYLVLPLIVVWAFWTRPQLRKTYLLSLLASFGLGSFYFLPLIFELKFTQTLTRASGTNFKNHFVYLHQLWNSTWNYGGSVPGPNDGMSFKLGKLHLILGFLGILSTFKLASKQRRWWLFFSFLLVFSLLFSLSISQPLWNLIKPLQYLQFPWRFLGLASFSLAILTAASLFLIPRFFRPLLVIVFSFFLIFFNLKYFRPNPVSPYLSSSVQFTTNYLANQLTDEVPEYQPKWFHLPPQNYPFPQVNSTYNSLTLQLKLDQATTITLPRAYYPTWKLIVNHHSHPYFSGDYGLLSFKLEPGHYEIQLYQSHTQLEILASFISLFTLLWLIVYVSKK